MESLLPAFEGAVTQGVLWGIMVLGVYITYRILDIADLTVDGSFALGGSVCAVCVANGMNPFFGAAARYGCRRPCRLCDRIFAYSV